MEDNTQDNTPETTEENSTEVVKPLTDKQKLFIKCFLSALGNVTSACEKAGISRECYYHWRKQSTLFSETCDREVRDHYQGFVEGKMYKIINGMSITETVDIFDGKGKKIKTIKTVKELPPNQQMLKFLLSTKFGYKEQSGIDVTSNGETVKQVFIFGNGDKMEF